MTDFELAVQDAAGLAVARRVGPDRIELATALPTGGLTPSAGLVELAVETGLPVHVLVRPRLGDVEYDDQDRDLLEREARSAVAAGVAGIVVGGTRGGAVDTELVRAALDFSGGAEVTFHRAFDTVTDRFAALDILADLGVTRVLTSGGAANAADALDELRALARHAAGRIQLMAGSGIDAENAARVAETGVDAVHASAKRVVTGAVTISFGSAVDGGVSSYETTDEAIAVAIRDAVRA